MNKKSSKHARILNSEFRICLMHSIRLLYKLLSIYEGSDIFRHCQAFKMEYFAKTVMNKCRRATRKLSSSWNFRATILLFLLFYMFQSLGFRICHGCICNGYTYFWIYLNMDICLHNMSQYALISPNICDNVWILFNTLEYVWKHQNELFWLCQGSQ